MFLAICYANFKALFLIKGESFKHYNNVGWNILMWRYQWRRDKSWQTDTAQKPGNHLECHLTHFKRNSSRLKPLKCPQEWNQCSKTFICQVRSFQAVVQLICGSLGGCKWPSLALISCISRIWDVQEICAGLPVSGDTALTPWHWHLPV